MAKEGPKPAALKGEVIITATGRNRPGVLAEVTSEIARMNGNIMDIGQQMVREFFNLIMFVNISESNVDFAVFKDRLEGAAQAKGYKLSVQHEKIFHYMHRI